MTMRLTKIMLPHPMPVPFAGALVKLMTGFEQNSLQGSFAVVHALCASWAEDDPVTVVDIHHRMVDSATPDLQALVRHKVSSADEDSKALRQIIRVLTPLVQCLEEMDPVELSILRDEVTHHWTNGMREIARGADSSDLAAQFAKLLEDFGAPIAIPGADGFAANFDPQALPRGARMVMMPPGMNPVEFLQQMFQGRGNMAKEADANMPKPEPLDPSKPAACVYRQADAVSQVQRLPAHPMPGEGNAQQRRLLEFMASSEGMRMLMEVPEGNPLEELYSRFPHFKEVLDLVAESLALAGCGTAGKPVRIPPILLRGEPGTGKTFFAQELARVLCLHFVERDLSVTSEAFVLAGMDSGWKNSKPGVVFDAVVNGKSANPLILLNEVDKASTTGTHNSPLAALHALLEPTSSHRFVDEFIPLPIDTSHVIWVLTANKGNIPAPILDRLEEFDIRMPTREECRVIAASVWSTICSRGMPAGHGFCTELGDPLLDYMSLLSPRVMRKALTKAAGRAALAGRSYLMLEDLESSKKRYAPAVKQSIGFVPQAQSA
jgi:ATP-dependent Lon protease